MIPIGGWKTKVGFALIIIGGALKALQTPTMITIGEASHQLGMAIMGLGIAHKVAKLK